MVRQARTLITASDDDDEDADSQLDGYKNGDEDVFVVTLERSTRGLGLGLIDGNVSFEEMNFFSLYPNGHIFDVLRNLVSIVQFKKYEKHPWRSVTFSKVAAF